MTVYKNSIAYSTVMSSTKEQLLIRVKYTKGAIETHREQGNAGEVTFFEEELKLINKKLKQ